MVLYLITLICSRRNVYVSYGSLSCILNTLLEFGVYFYRTSFENHGYYKQLHVHALVHYIGRFSHLNKFLLPSGIYRVNWKKITPGTVPNVCQYLSKQDSLQALAENLFIRYRFDQDTQQYVDDALP